MQARQSAAGHLGQSGKWLFGLGCKEGHKRLGRDKFGFANLARPCLGEGVGGFSIRGSDSRQ